MSQDTVSIKGVQDDSDPNVSYAMLDQSLWKNFQSADDVELFLQSWLAIQCRQIGADVRGLLVIGETPDIGPFQHVAVWPANATASASMQETAQKALEKRSGTVQGENTQNRVVASPLLVYGQLFGAVVIDTVAVNISTAEIFRRLQWGAGWIEIVLRREQETKDGELRERVTTAFDMIASVLEHPKFADANSALVTELAGRMECERVSIGFSKRRYIKLAAISHMSSFGKRSGLIRDICNAMDEAADQKTVIVWPEPDGWEFRVTRASEDLVQTYGMGSVLTVPLQYEGEVTGALVFERPLGQHFSPVEVEICDAVASVVGPILIEKKENDRLLPTKILSSISGLLSKIFGPSYFGFKLATIGIGLLAVFFSYAKIDYRISSPAVIEGTIQRSVIAPFNGYLSAQYASAGDVVMENGILASLDDKDLTLERLRLHTSKRQRESELDRALADRQLAEVNIIRAQIEQTDAQLALIEEQLKRTQVRAPFDGYIIEGDLTQSIGGSVERGQLLFRIAPLESFRVLLEIDEREIQEVEVGQKGQLRVSAMPEIPLEYRVNQITPLAQQSDGRNWFRIEADLLTAVSDLRPGMEGVARTEIDERLLIVAMTHRLANWAQIFFWKWQP